MSAQIIPFPSPTPAPPVRRNCGECLHAFLGSTGVYCGVFREEIANEYLAGECEEFED